jgi:hypothetical protein
MQVVADGQVTTATGEVSDGGKLGSGGTATDCHDVPESRVVRIDVPPTAMHIRTVGHVIWLTLRVADAGRSVTHDSPPFVVPIIAGVPSPTPSPEA